MKLIQKVEIRYFRSLYRADFANCGHLNIAFGRNDSGKSNFLRALNLFFNNQSDPDRQSSFKIDLSDLRLVQAQQGQSRQFFYVKIYFNVPPNYRSSLGEMVWVKKQWNRDGDVNTIYPSGLTTGSKIQLTKLLSKIDFTYIPAIKDTNSFRKLVRRMYEATSEGAGLQGATNQFIESIREETADLSEALSNTLGSITRLDAPPEMGELFRALDFAHGEDGHSLLLQKGDGIKARHIPELLRYINDKERNCSFFIWGFEEPENSLDISAAIKEAGAFKRFSERNDTQIFVTSHSPAFYLAHEENQSSSVRRFFISKQRVAGGGEVAPINSAAAINTLDLAEEAMEAANLSALPFTIRKLSTLQEQRDALANDHSRLEAQLEAIQQPTIFVEGESESVVVHGRLNEAGVAIAARKLRGTPSTTSELLKRIISAGGAVGQAPSFFLFDNDDAGRAAYKNLIAAPPCESPVSLCAGISAWCLPFSEHFEQFLARHQIPRNRAFFPLEFVFDGDLSALILSGLMSSAEIEGAEAQIRQEYHEILHQSVSHGLRKTTPGTADWLWARGVPNRHKQAFFQRCMEAAVPSQLDDILNVVVASFG